MSWNDNNYYSKIGDGVIFIYLHVSLIYIYIYISLNMKLNLGIFNNICVRTYTNRLIDKYIDIVMYQYLNLYEYENNWIINT